MKTRPFDGAPPWLAPLGIFLLLAALTAAVWWEQVTHQRQLLSRHTEDVCVQASRRAEVFFASRLSVAELWATRWATHEDRDFSRPRFEAFGAVVLHEQPGYRAISLVGAGGELQWSVPRSSTAVAEFLATSEATALREQVALSQRPALAPPVGATGDKVSLFGLVPLSRADEPLGYLLVELGPDALFGELFRDRIRTEFDFTVDDRALTVFRHAPDPEAAALLQGPLHVTRSFEVWNRSWSMTVTPRPKAIRAASWRASILVPSFGLALSVGLSVLAYLLALRIRAHRRARDSAIQEVAERRRAEKALRASEARYRSVFDSATEGLVVLHPNGRIVDANEAACRLHGYAAGELDGRQIRELIADDCQHDYDVFVAHIKRGGTVNLESVVVDREDRRIDVEVHGTRFTHRGKPALLAVMVNVTERKAAQLLQQRLSQRLLRAQEEERGRLSRDLHDSLGQTLTAVRFQLGLLSKQASDPERCKEQSFEQASELLESAADELRRMCKGLRPPVLDDLGLEPAARQLVQEFAEHTGDEVELEFNLDDDRPRLTADVALCAYRVLQEALTNVQRHADASKVAVTITSDDDSLTMTIRDDGRGFNPGGGSARIHYGIAGMRERAGLVDGTIALRSAPGEGTRVVLRVPHAQRRQLEDT